MEKLRKLLNECFDYTSFGNEWKANKIDDYSKLEELLSEIINEVEKIKNVTNNVTNNIQKGVKIK